MKPLSHVSSDVFQPRAIAAPWTLLSLLVVVLAGGTMFGCDVGLGEPRSSRRHVIALHRLPISVAWIPLAPLRLQANATALWMIDNERGLLLTTASASVPVPPKPPTIVSSDLLFPVSLRKQGDSLIVLDDNGLVAFSSSGSVLWSVRSFRGAHDFLPLGDDMYLLSLVGDRQRAASLTVVRRSQEVITERTIPGAVWLDLAPCGDAIAYVPNSSTTVGIATARLKPLRTIDITTGRSGRSSSGRVTGVACGQDSIFVLVAGQRMSIRRFALDGTDQEVLEIPDFSDRLETLVLSPTPTGFPILSIATKAGGAREAVAISIDQRSAR